MAQNHAVVIGASGLIGWGVVNELLSHDYIAAGAFGTVTAIVNRPVNRDDMFWPSEHPSQPKLLLVDGVNLMDDQEKITALLKAKNAGCQYHHPCLLLRCRRDASDTDSHLLMDPESSGPTTAIRKRKWR